MSEVEFLPEWYPVLLRRRKQFRAQLSAAVLVSLLLLAWGRSINHRLAYEMPTAGALELQVKQARADFENVRHIQSLRASRQDSDAAIHSASQQVLVSSLLASLQRVAPPHLVLTELNLDRLDAAKPIGGVSADTTDATHVHVVLKGVASSQQDVAAFQTGLGNLAGASQVSVGNARDQTVAAHVVREFEIGFELAAATEGRH